MLQFHKFTIIIIKMNIYVPAPSKATERIKPKTAATRSQFVDRLPSKQQDKIITMIEN